ncbi:MAG: hypothetical protein Q9217_006264 [Psora testacea]
MSGLEVLGAIGSVEALLEGAIRIYKYSKEVAEAEEDKERLRSVLGGYREMLELLAHNEREARGTADEVYYKGLFSIAQGGKQAKSENQGALIGLTKAMNSMEYHLRPRSGLKSKMMKFKWSLDKTKINSLLREIQEWRSQIEFIISLDTNRHIKEARKVVVAGQTETQQLARSGRAIANYTQKIETTTQETSVSVRTIAAGVQALNERELKKDREYLSNWLSPLDFNARHSEIYEKCIDISKSLLESTEFQAWRSGRPWILFCWAEAGAGKTMLVSLTIEHLRSYYSDRNIPVLGVYLNHKEHKSQTLKNLIGGLLRQLIQYRNYAFCPEELVKTYEEKSKGLSINEMRQAFCEQCTNHERVIILVDALDEGTSEIQRFYNKLLPLLPLDRLSLMITSREEPPEKDKAVMCDNGKCRKGPLQLFYRCQICEYDLCYECKDGGETCGIPAHEFVEPYANEEVYLDIAPSEDDIEKYVKGEIYGELVAHRAGRMNLGLHKSQAGTTALGRLCRGSPQLEKEIVDVVCAKAAGKFMLAKLYLDSLRVKLSRAEVNQALKELPLGYTKVYEQTMDRINAVSANNPNSHASLRATKTLYWVACTHRPLRLVELQHALAVNWERGFDEDDVCDKETLLEVTAGLIMVDREDGDVRLSHYTAQEYFNGPGRKWFSFNVSTEIASVCLRYISSEDLSIPCNSLHEDEEFEDRCRRYPFLRYAYEYWGIHVKESGSGMSTEGHAAILDFLRDARRVATFVQAFWYLESSESSRWEIRKGANGLHIASWFGLTSILSDLVQGGLEVNSKDPSHQQTPLMYASRRGHCNTVAKLLELGAPVNELSARDSTAILEAVRENHIDVMTMLSSRLDLDINKSYFWDFNRTILMLAVQRGRQAMVRSILRRKDLNVNQKDSMGYNALSLASAFGHTAIVKELLTYDGIDLNCTSRNGSSALILAAGCKNHAAGNDIADLLLSHGADATIEDKEGGGSAIMRAVDNGNLMMVENLLEHGIDIGVTDNEGRGLLHAAAVNDRCEVAEMLIGKGLKVDARDMKKRTPLHDASRFGNREMVELLIRRATDPTLKDQSGRTAWTAAWQNNQTAILPLLTDTLDPKGASSLTYTLDRESLPVWSLAKLGDEDVISKRMNSKNRNSLTFAYLDPDTDDSAVHCAVQSDRPSILRMLLEAGLSPNARNSCFRTPLHQAALNPDQELMETLLAFDPDLNVKDEAGTTPLWLARVTNNQRCALRLVEAGAEIEEKAMILPLFFAAVEYGFTEAVKILIEKHNAPLLAKNQRGESALQVAKQNGHGKIIQLLLQNKSQYTRATTVSIASSKESESLPETVSSAFIRPDIWEEEKEEFQEQAGIVPIDDTSNGTVGRKTVEYLEVE